MKNNNSTGWTEIPQTARPSYAVTREKLEKEKLKYWSKFWSKKNHVKATCSSF